MVKPSLLAPCVLLLHLLPGSQAEEGSEAEPLGVRGLELGPLHEPSQGNPALGRPMGGSGGGPQTSGFLGLPRGKGIVRWGGASRLWFRHGLSLTLGSSRDTREALPGPGVSPAGDLRPRRFRGPGEPFVVARGTPGAASAEGQRMEMAVSLFYKFLIHQEIVYEAIPLKMLWGPQRDSPCCSRVRAWFLGLAFKALQSLA